MICAQLFGDHEQVVDDVLRLPLELLARSSGSCVAMPTGQVLRWHLRIMMQPSAMSGAVLKAESLRRRAIAAMATSRPVFICRRFARRREREGRSCTSV